MASILADKKKLIVKRSRLADAGKGLFTKVFIPKGTRIVPYKGRIISWGEVDEDNPYIYYVNRKHVIDARPYKKALARYANDARGLAPAKGLRNNSKYAEEGLNVFIEAVKDIPAGQEILVPYGKEYWDAIKHNLKLAKEKK
jgi:SET domain-containing protein